MQRLDPHSPLLKTKYTYEKNEIGRERQWRQCPEDDFAMILRFLPWNKIGDLQEGGWKHQRITPLPPPLPIFECVMPKIPYKQGYKDFISLGSSSFLSIHSKKCIHNVRMCHIEGLLRLKASPHTPSYLSVCPYYSQPYSLESHKMVNSQ